MRKGILILSLAVLLLAVLSSFAYSQYKIAVLRSQNDICGNQVNKGSEILFESIVKQFVGAVKF
jgi:Tfp pilus assembly protein PilE